MEDLVGLAETSGVLVISKAGPGWARAGKTSVPFPPLFEFDLYSVW